MTAREPLAKVHLNLAPTKQGPTAIATLLVGYCERWYFEASLLV